jgi:hypothetical protein
LQRVLTTVTLLGLLVATAAAFAITEHLKLIKSPVYGTLVSKELSPVCGPDCRERSATIRIRIRHRDRVTVKILSGGHVIATVASNAPRPARKHLRFAWHGRTDTGARAPDGVYHAEVHLANAHRTILLPNRIVLDTKTPQVLSARSAKDVLLAGPGRSVAIRYAFSEQANAVVFLRGRQIIRGRPTRQSYRIKWSGTLHGRPLPAGAYVLSVGARDAAGNTTPARARKNVTVVVRYVDVTPGRLDVHPGARFTVRVETAASRYNWRLGQRHGFRRGHVLGLRAPTTPGTYRLVVGEHGHTTTALVRVRTK